MSRPILVAVLLVWLLKDPLIFYRAVGSAYSIAYAGGCLLVIFDALVVGKFYVKDQRGFWRTYLVYCIGSILGILISGFTAGFEFVASVRTIANFVLYFLIFHVVSRLTLDFRVLGVFVKVMAWVAGMNIVVYLLNSYVGWVPSLPITAEISSGDGIGTAYLHIPWGVGPQFFPVLSDYLRMQGFFSEPAWFGMFCFFSILLTADSRMSPIIGSKSRFLLILVLLGGCIVSKSMGTLIFALITMAMFIYSRNKILFLPFLAAASLSLYSFFTQDELTTDAMRRLGSFYDRYYQYSTAIDRILNKPMGFGFSDSVAPEQVFSEHANQLASYDNFTNVFAYIYYLGIVIIPFLLYLLFRVYGYYSRDIKTSKSSVNYYAYAMMFLLLCDFSVNMFFTPIHLFLLALYLRNAPVMGQRNSNLAVSV